MDQKIQTELERASELFYQWRLREAYTIFKRYFDRLPFKPERGHLKYIGMFVRTLFELGKNRELGFYRTTLDRLYENTKSPEIGYQLAYFNLDESNPNLKFSKTILEDIINHSEIFEYKNKARMLLAYCYDVLFDDVSSVRKLIDSIEGETDQSMLNLLVTWKAKVLRDEGNCIESKVMLEEFLSVVSIENDWYAHLTARLTLAYTLFELGEVDSCNLQIREVHHLIEGRPAKSIENRLKLIEKKVEQLNQAPKITLKDDGTNTRIILNGRAHSIDVSKRTEQLLLLFMKKRFLSKSAIYSAVSNKSEVQNLDDGVIYSTIHSVRKLIDKFGISKNAIQTSEGGYKFIPEVEVIGDAI